VTLFRYSNTPRSLRDFFLLCSSPYLATISFYLLPDKHRFFPPPPFILIGGTACSDTVFFWPPREPEVALLFWVFPKLTFASVASPSLLRLVPTHPSSFLARCPACAASPKAGASRVASFWGGCGVRAFFLTVETLSD